MENTLEIAERAVTQLSAKDLAKFRRWFAKYDGAAWDEQIEADAKSGRLDSLAQEALAEYRTGKSPEI